MNDTPRDYQDITNEEELETREWLDSLDYVLSYKGPERVNTLLRDLNIHARQAGVEIPFTANTPFINTIPRNKQPSFPGNRETERRIKSILRWNAMAMVVGGNKRTPGIGGHISTYASAATLYEVAFNHIFRGRSENYHGDLVYFQGHASPGIYARAFLEGRITEHQLLNFRRELAEGGGLSSYPHPWLMPNFWQFPTVSMGLGPLQAIYQARFMRYLEDRGLKQKNGEKVFAYLGDGETDEPEALGSIGLASREKLDNLVFVINCNLQRLDGPVRGNGKIIQELEATFRGSGWNVIKVLWGDDWDEILEKEDGGLLVKRMEELVDGWFQKYIVSDGDFIRKHFFGADPRLLKLVEHLSDSQLRKLRYGGHDPEKVYAAYKAAIDNVGSPTVILARTIKGYGMGEAGEGKNITHQQKKLNEDEMREFRTRFSIPISDEQIAAAPFYKPADNSPEIQYIRERRKQLGGYVPSRIAIAEPHKTPPIEVFQEFLDGSGNREVSTTMVFVRILAKLLKDKELGKFIVPIVPDEARTFGMESLFRQCGIYSHVGQTYEPVDADTLLYYKEATDGQILEEGITEAGSLSSFIAAGTAYSTYGISMMPFYIFYSMFGLQRIGDLVWAAGDCCARGFLLGGTSGRTTLNGEGLQHEDGHSHLLGHPVPNMLCYDPAFGFELTLIIRDGIYRMFEKQENIFYYITVMNEDYVQPTALKGCEEGVLRGLYKYRESVRPNGPKANLFGSGAIMNEVLKAQQILEEKYGVAATVWSVTSYKELYRNADETERWNLLHPDQPARQSWLQKTLSGVDGVYVAASDYVKALPDMIAKWLPAPLTSLGTDGFGRSETREALRDFFEVDAKHIVAATLSTLAAQGKMERSAAAAAMAELGVDGEKPYPPLV